MARPLSCCAERVHVVQAGPVGGRRQCDADLVLACVFAARSCVHC